MDESRNIYYNARKTAGFTQERWAQMLGVSTQAVQQYEADINLPSEDIVQRMGEIAMLPPLVYWHLRHKSEIAAQELPPVERLPLAQAVCQLLARINDFQQRHRDLLQIAADGRVDELEKPVYTLALEELNAVVQAAIQLKFAEGGETDGKAVR